MDPHAGSVRAHFRSWEFDSQQRAEAARVGISAARDRKNSLSGKPLCKDSRLEPYSAGEKKLGRTRFLFRWVLASVMNGEIKLEIRVAFWFNTFREMMFGK